MNLTRLRELWMSRSPSERTTLLIATAVLAIALYVLLLVSANRGREQLKSSIPVLKVDAARLEQYAAEYGRLKSLPVVPASSSDLRTLAQAQIAAAGLTKNLTKLDAASVDQVQVSFTEAQFSNWLNLLTTLQAQRVRLESCQVTASTAAGFVNINATLVRTLPP